MLEAYGRDDPRALEKSEDDPVRRHADTREGRVTIG
jgi:hypothetical protein